MEDVLNSLPNGLIAPQQLIEQSAHEREHVDQRSLSIPLVPSFLVDFLDRIIPDWYLHPLRVAPEQNLDTRALPDLGVQKLGELRTVSPLVLLRIAQMGGSSARPLMEPDEFWSVVLDTVRAYVKPLLSNAVTWLLADRFPPTTTTNAKETHLLVAKELAGTIPGDEEDDRFCALFFDPADIVDLLRGVVKADHFVVAMPQGAMLLDAHSVSPLHSPVLTRPVREALQRAGCDLRALRLSVLSLDVRTAKMCSRVGYYTLLDLTLQTPLQLFQAYQLGPKAFTEIISALQRYLTPWLAHLPFEMLVPLQDSGFQYVAETQTVPQQGAEAQTPDALASDGGLHAREEPQPGALFLPIEEVLATPRIWNDPLLSDNTITSLAEAGCDLRLLSVNTLLHSRLDAGSSLAVLLRNALARAGLRHVDQIVQCSPSDLLGLRNFGAKCYRELCTSLIECIQPWLHTNSFAVQRSLTPNEMSQEPVGRLSNPSAAIRSSSDVSPAAAALPSQREIPLSLNETLLTLLDEVVPKWQDLRIRELPRIEVDGAVKLLSLFADAPVASILNGLGDGGARTLEKRAELEHLVAQLQRSLWGLVVEAKLAHASTDDSTALLPTIVEHVSIESLLDEIFAAISLHGQALKPRHIDVLYDRYGVRTGIPKTLADLGNANGVTRERARQMINRVEMRVLAEDMKSFVGTMTSLVTAIVQADGGVTTISAAAARLGNCIPFGSLDPCCTVCVLADWAPELQIIDDDTVVVDPYSPAMVESVKHTVRNVLGRSRGGLTSEQLLYKVLANKNKAITSTDIDFVSAVIRLMPDVVTLNDTVIPGRRGALQARIIQAMRSLGRPAHFRDIAAEYRRLYPDDEQRTANSIHAFFDRFRDIFVLVGNGIYALADQGYDPRINSVPAVVEHILEQSDRPLHFDEVIEQATKRYVWKANSISAQLMNNSRIRPLGNGFFGLKDRDYGKFDASTTYVEVFGESREARERLVVATYTNAAGHRVVQLKATVSSLGGAIRIVSRPLRELFPKEGTFLVDCWCPHASTFRASIGRSQFDLYRLRPLFAWAHSHAGDYLFIEQLSTSPGEGGLAYRLAFAPEHDVFGAMLAVGLTPSGEGNTALDAGVLHYALDPTRVMTLVSHALAHPWMAVTEANSLLGYAPSSPYGADYVRLALAGTLLASGVVHGSTAMLMRPTHLGRLLTHSGSELAVAGKQLALSLPAYRVHLRAIATSSAVELESSDSIRLLGESVTKSWDSAFGIRSAADAQGALDDTACMLSSSLLDSASIALLLLLLSAQSHGQCISTRELAALGYAGLRDAADRLRVLGIHEIGIGSDRVALGERVNLAVASVDSIDARLREDATVLADALAAAWRSVSGAAWPRHTMLASDLYAALERDGPHLLHPLLISPLEQVPEHIQYYDARLFPSGFTTLAADWGLVAHSEEHPPFAFLHHATTHVRKQPVAPVAVSLSRALLDQEWDAPRHIAANAHLALLVLIAGDMGDLAERITYAAGGWSIAGEPLVRQLDAVLRSLGYDVWDEVYCDNVARQTDLAWLLVGLGERLGLLVRSGNQLEAIGSLASAVYYSGYDVLARIHDALDAHI